MLTKEQREWLVALASILGNEESAAVAEPQAAPPPKLGQATLEKAPEVWHDIVLVTKKSLDQLKTTVRKELADETKDVLAEIEQHLSNFDAILDTLDHSLGDAVAKARSASNPTDRLAALKAARAIYVRCLKFITSDPLVAHIDSNPFGVDTDLVGKVGGTLKQLAPLFA